MSRRVCGREDQAINGDDLHDSNRYTFDYISLGLYIECMKQSPSHLLSICKQKSDIKWLVFLLSLKLSMLTDVCSE